MNGRAIAVVGAPSSIGIRPYDSGKVRHVDRTPAVLRELRLLERIGALDLGDVFHLRIEITFVRLVVRATNTRWPPTPRRSATVWRRPPTAGALCSCSAATAASSSPAFWARSERSAAQ
jgi:hypothetical protein